MKSSAAQRTHPTPGSPAGARVVVQLVWLVAGLALSFAIPFIGSDVLVLPLTLYYLLYFVLVLAFLGAYVRFTGVDVGALIRRRWRMSLALGLLAGAFVVSRVLTEAATPGPAGARYVFELLWRGAFYGTVDALLLTVFPCLVVLGLLGGDVRGAARNSSTSWARSPWSSPSQGFITSASSSSAVTASSRPRSATR